MPNSLSLVAAAAVVQLVLITALVAQWRRGRSLHLLFQQRAGADERAGALVHELNQPLTAILSNAQAAQRFLATDHPDIQEVREILEDIVMDDKRAAGIVRNIGGLLQEAKLIVAAPGRTQARSDNSGVHKERMQ